MVSTANPTTPQPLRAGGMPLPHLGVFATEEVPTGVHCYALAAGAASTVDIGPLTDQSIYQITFAALSGGSVVDSGVAPPDVHFVVATAAGSTVTAMSSPFWPASTERAMPPLLLHEGQTYIKFLNCSTAKGAVICVYKLR